MSAELKVSTQKPRYSAAAAAEIKHAKTAMRNFSALHPLFFALRKIPAFRNAFVRQPALAIECRHASRSGGRHRLSIDVIDDVAAREDALDVGHGRIAMRQHDVSA